MEANASLVQCPNTLIFQFLSHDNSTSSAALIGEVFTPVDGIGALLIISGCAVNEMNFEEFATKFNEAINR